MNCRICGPEESQILPVAAHGGLPRGRRLTSFRHSRLPYWICPSAWRCAPLVQTAPARTRANYGHEGPLDSQIEIVNNAAPSSSIGAPMTNHRPVALVTGSTSGIGAAIAKRLSSDGYSIVLHSRSSAEAGQAMARELESAIYIQADLANDADRVRLIRETVASWGRLDVLVNNAGISRVIPHVNMAAATPAIWQELYEVNVIAPFRLIAEAEHELRAAARRGRSGSVVNISSHAGVRPKGASIPYSATKAALNHMTCLLALSLGPDIRVNSVAPGLVDTPLTADWTQAQDLWRTRAPMRRSARPEDIAQAVAMLVASDYLTGEILLSDGGLNLT